MDLIPRTFPYDTSHSEQNKKNNHLGYEEMESFQLY